MRELLVRRHLAAVTAAVVLLSSGDSAASTQIPANRTILVIGSYAEFGYITFSPPVPNLEGCSYAVGDQVAVDWSGNPNNKSIYVTALAAYVAGQKVGFGVSGCHSGGLPVLYRVDVTQ